MGNQTSNQQNNNPRIFISHSSKDAELVKILEGEITSHFDYNINVFASTRPNAIETGSKWFSKVMDDLKEADALIVVITPDSIESHWIWYELGYYWRIWHENRELRTIYPLYIKDIELPYPLSEFQGRELNDRYQMARFFRDVTKRLKKIQQIKLTLKKQKNTNSSMTFEDIDPPTINMTDLDTTRTQSPTNHAYRVTEFVEENYSVIPKPTELIELKSFNPSIFEQLVTFIFRRNKTVD